MNDITNRFIEVYNYLISTKNVASKADFAQKIEISSSMFTEISKGRSNVGLNAIQNTVKTFDFINSHWILTGNGSLDLRDSKITYTPDLNSENTKVNNNIQPNNAPPTKGKIAPATAPPNLNLGVPRVVTVTEDNSELVNLVSAKAAAGYLNGYADPEFIEGLPTIRLPNLKGGTHRGFEVKGHSMNPTIHNGAIAVGRWVESLEDIKENYVYIVVTKSDGIVVKRVLNRINESGKLILKSDNNNKKEFPNIILDQSDVIELWRLRGGFIFEFAEPNEINHRMNDLEAKYTLLADQIQKLIK